jgi:excisionase family DNA binding protein
MHGTPDTYSPSGGTPVISPVERLFYSADEAAAATTISRKEIYRLMESGALEVAEYGRRRLIPADSLKGFARKLRNDSAAKRLAGQPA